MHKKQRSCKNKLRLEHTKAARSHFRVAISLRCQLELAFVESEFRDESVEQCWLSVWSINAITANANKFAAIGDSFNRSFPRTAQWNIGNNRREALIVAGSSALKIHFSMLPSQLFHCLSSIIAARLATDERLHLTMCEWMRPRIRGTPVDMDAVRELAWKDPRFDASSMDEFVLFEDVPAMEDSIFTLIRHPKASWQRPKVGLQCDCRFTFN